MNKRLKDWLTTPIESPYHLLGLQRSNPKFQEGLGFILDGGWFYQQDGWNQDSITPGPMLSIIIYGTSVTFSANVDHTYLDVWHMDYVKVGVLWGYLP